MMTSRSLIRSAALGALLVRPVLLTLGLTKAVELCQNCKSNPNTPNP